MYTTIALLESLHFIWRTIPSKWVLNNELIDRTDRKRYETLGRNENEFAGCQSSQATFCWSVSKSKSQWHRQQQDRQGCLLAAGSNTGWFLRFFSQHRSRYISDTRYHLLTVVTTTRRKYTHHHLHFWSTQTRERVSLQIEDDEKKR